MHLQCSTSSAFSNKHNIPLSQVGTQSNHPSRAQATQPPPSSPFPVGASRPGGQDDAQSVASCPSLVSYDVNGCLGPMMGRRRRRWRGYVLRGLDNNAGFGTGVMVVRMAHQCRRPIAMAAWWAASRRSGLFGGKHPGWVPAVAMMVMGVRQDSRVVGVARQIMSCL